jgi:cobalamin biosynthesis protein CobD/CbiB
MIPTLNKNNWHEPAAYISAGIALAWGVLASLKIDSAWLGRAGAVVIVVGVLLASSRKIDDLHQRVLKFVDGYRSSNPQQVRDEFRSLKGREPTEVEAKELEDAVYASANEDIDSLIEQRRRIFKLHEVALVVVGTLTNGFGEWLMKLVLAHAA